MIHGFAPVMKLNCNAELAASPRRVNPSVFHCRRLVRLLKLPTQVWKVARSDVTMGNYDSPTLPASLVFFCFQTCGRSKKESLCEAVNREICRIFCFFGCDLFPTVSEVQSENYCCEYMCNIIWLF